MWSNDLELIFLEYYKQEPVLWDTTHDHYKDRSKVQDAWNRISKIIHIPVKELKRKKDSLMATFRAHSRRRRRSLLSGAAAEDVYKPIWFAFEFMSSFLGEHSKIENITITKNNTKKKNTETKAQQRIKEDPLQQRCKKDEAFNIRPPPMIRHKQNLTKLKKSQPNIREVICTLKTILNRNQLEDDCDLYGKMLAKKLRMLTDDDRLLFMHEIDGIFIRRLKELHKTETGPSWTTSQLQLLQQREGSSACAYTNSPPSPSSAHSREGSCINSDNCFSMASL